MTSIEKRNLTKRFDRANNPNNKRRIKRIEKEKELIEKFLKGSK